MPRRQPLIDACFRDGCYYRFDYPDKPRGRLGESETVWIAAPLKECERRE